MDQFGGGFGGEALPTQQPAAAAMPRVTEQKQFDALKKGDMYVGADGRSYRKP
jgi:hypothetical protein